MRSSKAIATDSFDPDLKSLHKADIIDFIRANFPEAYLPSSSRLMDLRRIAKDLISCREPAAIKSYSDSSVRPQRSKVTQSNTSKNSKLATEILISEESSMEERLPTSTTRQTKKKKASPSPKRGRSAATLSRSSRKKGDSVSLSQSPSPKRGRSPVTPSRISRKREDSVSPSPKPGRSPVTPSRISRKREDSVSPSPKRGRSPVTPSRISRKREDSVSPSPKRGQSPVTPSRISRKREDSVSPSPKRGRSSGNSSRSIRKGGILVSLSPKRSEVQMNPSRSSRKSVTFSSTTRPSSWKFSPPTHSSFQERYQESLSRAVNKNNNNKIIKSKPTNYDHKKSIHSKPSLEISDSDSTTAESKSISNSPSIQFRPSSDSAPSNSGSSSSLSSFINEHSNSEEELNSYRALKSASQTEKKRKGSFHQERKYKEQKYEQKQTKGDEFVDIERGPLLATSQANRSLCNTSPDLYSELDTRRRRERSKSPKSRTNHRHLPVNGFGGCSSMEYDSSFWTPAGPPFCYNSPYQQQTAQPQSSAFPWNSNFTKADSQPTVSQPGAGNYNYSPVSVYNPNSENQNHPSLYTQSVFCNPDQSMNYSSTRWNYQPQGQQVTQVSNNITQSIMDQYPNYKPSISYAFTPFVNYNYQPSPAVQDFQSKPRQCYSSSLNKAPHQQYHHASQVPIQCSGSTSELLHQKQHEAPQGLKHSPRPSFPTSEPNTVMPHQQQHQASQCLSQPLESGFMPSGLNSAKPQQQQNQVPQSLHQYSQAGFSPTSQNSATSFQQHQGPQGTSQYSKSVSNSSGLNCPTSQQLQEVSQESRQSPQPSFSASESTPVTLQQHQLPYSQSSFSNFSSLNRPTTKQQLHETPHRSRHSPHPSFSASELNPEKLPQQQHQVSQGLSQPPQSVFSITSAMNCPTPQWQYIPQHNQAPQSFGLHHQASPSLNSNHQVAEASICNTKSSNFQPFGTTAYATPHQPAFQNSRRLITAQEMDPQNKQDFESDKHSAPSINFSANQDSERVIRSLKPINEKIIDPLSENKVNFTSGPAVLDDSVKSDNASEADKANLPKKIDSTEIGHTSSAKKNYPVTDSFKSEKNGASEANNSTLPKNTDLVFLGVRNGDIKSKEVCT
ncbi:hypothetical protein PPACK8108_LOCUS5576 [Phakopsora pachyrhizi]|uniref:Uncharacterized protein n=1 Tax=Phakopsora pachyrhizi TaxID=170000 RepID=A0AAV0AP74_PHAPC|nr:hypothetical protein PPACK8108_LOCUS5576 [Phakopsora pachyrhizi]